MEMCAVCKKKEVQIKRSQLCMACYQKQRRGTGRLPTDKEAKDIKSNSVVSLYENEGEFHFIRNFFDHVDWIHKPAIFYLGSVKYTPDFYDKRRGVFIEVSATRQAYHQNKEKYALMREYFPLVPFEIRVPTGALLSEEHGDMWTHQTHKQEDGSLPLLDKKELSC